MQIQAQLKKQEMQMQHQFDMQLKQVEVQGVSKKEEMIEDRKDKRSKMEATQASELISQRKNDSPPINFEEPAMQEGMQPPMQNVAAPVDATNEEALSLTVRQSEDDCTANI